MVTKSAVTDTQPCSRVSVHGFHDNDAPCITGQSHLLRCCHTNLRAGRLHLPAYDDDGATSRPLVLPLTPLIREQSRCCSVAAYVRQHAPLEDYNFLEQFNNRPFGTGVVPSHVSTRAAVCQHARVPTCIGTEHDVAALRAVPTTPLQHQL